MRGPITRIALTGFMGAGKSTLGPLLAAELGWLFVDLDQAISAAHDASIAELFSLHGEAGFREREADQLAALLHRERTVIALGGGTLELERTRSLLFCSSDTYVVFLETPLALALARCEQQPDAAVRPLLLPPDGQHGGNRDELGERFARRQQHYRQAHTTLSTAGRTPGELVQLLLSSLPAPAHNRNEGLG